jgi:hypothetical protein
MFSWRRLFLLALLAIAATMAIAQRNSQKDTADAALVDRGATLHDAARLVGGVYKSSRVNTDGMLAYPDLKSLARQSSDILVIVPERNECKLSPDGRDIFTHYDVRVEQKLKGRFNPGDHTFVELPGGRFSWDDGTTAQIVTPYFRKMVNGMRYLVFLQRKATDKEYTPTGGSQGIVLLKDDGTVVPFAHNPEKHIDQLRSKTHFSLLEDVRSAAESD